MQSVPINTDIGLSMSCDSLWFSPGPPVSSTTKTDRHDITEILLKVALKTIKQTNKTYIVSGFIITNYECICEIVTFLINDTVFGVFC